MLRTKMSLVSLCALVLTLIVPIISRPARAATGREPVIVIPGVAGSEFSAASSFQLSVDNGHGGTYTRTYGAGEKVWVNTWEAAALGDDDYFDALKLKADGVTPVAPSLYVSGLYGSAYDDLIDYLQRQGYVQGVDLWIFPYDWRTDISLTAAQLDARISQALVTANGGRTDPATWTIRRADIVAHSMGGMVARYYIADPARASRVDQLITLGSPQLGAAKFFKALIYGDQFGPSFLGIGLNPGEIKDVVQNMTGAMQLLPSDPYYAYYDNSDSARLRPYVEDRDMDGDGVARGALSYAQTRQLLLNMGKNPTVIGKAQTYHAGIDGLRGGGVNGVRWAALIGYGVGTPGQIREYTGSCWSWYRYVPCAKRDETPIDGDGTVGLMSAAMGDRGRNLWIDSGAQRWYVQRDHGALVQADYTLGVRSGDGPALTWIGDLLAGRISMLSANRSIASASAVGVQAGDPLDGAWIAAIGPVAAQLSDADGKITGRQRGAEESAHDVPSARYERLPDAEFMFVKRGTPYILSLAAEQQGSTDLKIRVLGNGKVARTALYLGVTLSANGRAQLAIKPGSGNANAPEAWPELQIDADGDGVFEASTKAAAILDERESADTSAPSLDVPTPVQGMKRTIVASWTASDDVAGLLTEQAFIDPDTADARPVANGEQIELAPGQHRLVVVAIDRAGNAVSRETTFTVTE